MATRDPQIRIERYLTKLRRELRGRPASAANKIVAELRNHIVERAAIAGEITEESVEEVLRRLGPAEDLAEQYAIDASPADQVRGHIERIGDSGIPRWTKLMAGVPMLLLAAVIYFLGAAFFVCALSKPFHPYTAGLWSLPDPEGLSISLRLGFGGDFPPTGAADLLGWWIVPGGLVLGAVLLVVATYLLIYSFRLQRDSREMARESEGGIAYGR